MSAGDAISRKLESALALHRGGSFAQAEALYREALTETPGRADVMHLLAVLCEQTARTSEALAFSRQAAETEPSNAKYHLSLGAFLKARGHLDEAEIYLRRAIQLQPDSVEGQMHLGDLRALRADWIEARQHYLEATIRRPQWADAHHRLGISLAKLGDSQGAIQCYRKALEINPSLAGAWNDLGIRYAGISNFDAAIDAYHRAVTIRPTFAGAHNNLGGALREAARPTEAVRSLRRAIELAPRDAAVLLNMASALRDCGDLDGAADAAREALSLRPEWEEAKYSLGHTLLLKGDFAGGWPDCEARWQRRVNRPEYPPDRLWNGEDISGLRVLLHADHGFGDTIQFARYATLVAARGAKVWIRCQPELRRFISTLEGIEGVVGDDQPPAFDRHCPLIALPRIFRTTLQSVPAKVPYLKADPQAVAQWRDRLSHEQAKLNVGLAWAGRPTFREDRYRSPHLAAMAPLASVEGARFYSLQKGEAAAEARTAPPGMALVDPTAELNDFADTAALIEALDLVISSDTAVVHIAGALGKRVWVALHYAPGFFWMLGREDSPWYPTMRLFRQSAPADWEPVMEKLAVELTALVKTRRPVA
jgi:tetratricopeptide (TPR) repeat protein